jgi:deoxycytidine triphosphate deaminase
MEPMDRNSVLNQKTPKQIEVERLSDFPSAPYPAHAATHSDGPHGVLLSDKIEYYCKKYRLLDPYKPENIKAANYELRVGLKYSVAGQEHSLKLGDPLKIPKFEVAVIEILETVNIPHFMIGRWNIRTKWAYKGLIWVGGPQVDAGFRGLLLCPIWNLSNSDFFIKCGEEIAIIDFEFTTPPAADSKQYPWNERSRYIFEDYEKPRSALVEEVSKAIDELRSTSSEDREKVEGILEQSRARIDNVTAVMFTALGILTAAITLFATKPLTAEQYWWDPTILWLSAATTLIALMAWVKAHSGGTWPRRIQLFVLIFTILALSLGLFRGQQQAKHLKDAEVELQQLKGRIDALEESKPAIPNGQH